MRDCEALGFVLHGTCNKHNEYLKSVRVPFSRYFLRNSYKRSWFSVGRTFRCQTLLAVKSAASIPPEVDLFWEQVKPDEYIVLGLACCFQRNNTGKLQELIVVEPLPTSTLETVLQGVPTSYKRLVATTYDKAKDISSLPAAFIEEERVTFCENFDERLKAATRTYRARSDAKKIQLGEVYAKTNFSTSPKRVLNDKFEPSFEDNVKQDISIDVYGRKKDETEIRKEIEDLYNA